MTRRRRALVVALGCLSILASCNREKPPAAPPSPARVDGVPIVLPEVSPAMAKSPAAQQSRIEAAIVRHLAASEAQRLGLGKTAVAGESEVQREERLRDAYFASLRDSVVLSDDDLRTHYEKTKVRFSVRQVELRRQPFASEAEARAADRRLGAAGRLPAEAQKIGPTPVESLPAEVLPEALVFTAPGQRAALQRDGHWALVELERIEVEPLPYETARPKVEASLRLIRAQQSYHAEIERLRAAAKVEIESPTPATPSANH
jgi:hypothetical protein